MIKTRIAILIIATGVVSYHAGEITTKREVTERAETINAIGEGYYTSNDIKLIINGN